jgi:transcriptional regulator with XRE-family HTH domain
MKIPLSLADQIGCNKSTLWRINNKLISPSPKLAEDILEALNWSFNPLDLYPGIAKLVGKYLDIQKSANEGICLEDLRPDIAELIDLLSQLEQAHCPRTKAELIKFLKWFFKGLSQDEICVMGQAAISMLKDILFATGIEDRKEVAEILKAVNG